VGSSVENGEIQNGVERDWRIPFRARVVMTHKVTGERMEGETRDLSMGGMYVKTLLPPRPGTILDVEIQMKPLNYRGAARVMRARDANQEDDPAYGMAVVWVDQSPNQKRLLSIRINDHVRGGGQLLEGNPYRGYESPRVARNTVAPAAAATQYRSRLIVGLAVAAVVVVVALLVLL
jgi:hypothetical protein